MAERYKTEGCAILDSGFHIGDFISPQHAQRIANALNAQQPAAAVPEGYALAPVEPTQRMMEVGAKEYGSFEYMPRAKEVQGWGARANAIYRAMLAAERKGGES